MAMRTTSRALVFSLFLAACGTQNGVSVPYGADRAMAELKGPEESQRETLLEIAQTVGGLADIRAAEEAGYRLTGYGPVVVLEDVHCEPYAGIHLVNRGLVDAEIDPMQPEALEYEPADGRSRPVAVTYLVPEEQSPDAAPVILEHLASGPIDLSEAGGSVWWLRAWLWKTNPDGVFATFNRNVSC